MKKYNTIGTEWEEKMNEGGGRKKSERKKKPKNEEESEEGVNETVWWLWKWWKLFTVMILWKLPLLIVQYKEGEKRKEKEIEKK